jgi:hypothetical protein
VRESLPAIDSKGPLSEIIHPVLGERVFQRLNPDAYLVEGLLAGSSSKGRGSSDTAALVAVRLYRRSEVLRHNFSNTAFQ